MKKKVSLLILTMFLSFTLITLANSNVSMLINNILINSPSKIETAQTAWNANGTPISTAINVQEKVAICSDGAGGAIIAFENNVNSIYAQKVYANGTKAWTVDGEQVGSSFLTNINLRMISDGSGGAIISWVDFNSFDYDIYAQKIDSSGATQWGGGGVTVSVAMNDQNYQEMCSDGAGGAIITWQDQQSGIYPYVDRLRSSDGASQWTSGGFQISTVSGYNPAICTDGYGGVIIGYHTGGGVSSNIVAQRVNSTGQTPWTPSGVNICTNLDEQRNAKVVNDNAGGAIFTWEDKRDGSYYHLYAQKLDADGFEQWPSDDVAICQLSSDQMTPQICSDGAGGAIITWTNTNISAQRISAAGNVLWTTNGVEICSASGIQNWPRIISDGFGGAIIVWKDERGGALNDDIYAQKIDASGVVQWTTDGILICNSANAQEYPQLCSDENGGAIIAWDDERGTDHDVYAQRVLGPPSDPSDWITLISLAVLASYGGLIEDMIESFLTTLLSPMVLGSIVLGQTLVIVILSSVIARQRKPSGKRKKSMKDKKS